MPQQSYVPLGSLRRAATYPVSPEEVDDATLKETLEAVGLGHLNDRLDEEAAWSSTLSGGEKQRLAFARLFVQKPDIVVMDEATSALDPASQDHLLQLVNERLPAATVMSVGHRPELEAFHSRKLVLEYQPEGAKLAQDVSLQGPLRRSARFLSQIFAGRGGPAAARVTPAAQRAAAAS
jgi:putative ATP-binding cassette transporter